MKVKCPVINKITLQQRLAQLVGRSIEINAAGLALEPGKLQSVCGAKFIRVQGELFVPASSTYLRVFGVSRTNRFRRVGLRITFQTSVSFADVQLVQIGRDFLELQDSSKKERTFVPLKGVVGIFSLK